MERSEICTNSIKGLTYTSFNINRESSLDESNLE